MLSKSIITRSAYRPFVEINITAASKWNSVIPIIQQGLWEIKRDKSPISDLEKIDPASICGRPNQLNCTHDLQLRQRKYHGDKLQK